MQMQQPERRVGKGCTVDPVHGMRPDVHCSQRTNHGVLAGVQPGRRGLASQTMRYNARHHAEPVRPGHTPSRHAEGSNAESLQRDLRASAVSILALPGKSPLVQRRAFSRLVLAVRTEGRLGRSRPWPNRPAVFSSAFTRGGRCPHRGARAPSTSAPLRTGRSPHRISRTFRAAHVGFVCVMTSDGHRTERGNQMDPMRIVEATMPNQRRKQDRCTSEGIVRRTAA